MKKLLLILSLVVFSFSAIGKVEKEFELPFGQAILCEEEKSIGFDWKNKKYVQSNYIKRKIIFKKINVFTDTKILKKCNSGYSFWLSSEKDNITKNWAVLNRCYSRQNLGNKPFFGYCKEHYNVIQTGVPMSSKNSQIWKIECQEFKFDPDGLFLSSPIKTSFDLSSNADYKDSFSISHGKCARF